MTIKNTLRDHWLVDFMTKCLHRNFRVCSSENHYAKTLKYVFYMPLYKEFYLSSDQNKWCHYFFLHDLNLALKKSLNLFPTMYHGHF